VGRPESEGGAEVGGFFQTSMYVPGSNLGLASAYSAGRRSTSELVQPRALHGPEGGEFVCLHDQGQGLSNLRSANYGTFVCPAFMP